MVFSSPVFLFLFLPLVLLFTLLAGRRSAQNSVLLVASLIFYWWGEGVYTLLMLGVILFNHLCGVAIERTASRRAVLTLAVVMNVGALAWFKYASFLADAIGGVLGGLGLPPLVLDPVHLPIGVSFFIFHSLSYVIDVYRGDARAQTQPGITALYITLFPQLVAGPIIRYHDVATQFTQRVMALPLFASGVQRFVVGLAKKVLIADQCARIADPIFGLDMGEVTTSVAWLGIVAYALQIYFDFSGYSDMAIGLGRMFGFQFLENFDRPYIARSIREFWQRWHISLSRWFRDYLYIPLGGNRSGLVRTYLNLYIVFFLTGLWHGASWSFVVWGLVHGTFMVVERIGLDKLLERAPRLVGNAYMLLVVLVAWAFFRVEDITGAWRYISAMFGVHRGVVELCYPELFLTNSTLLALCLGMLGALNLHVVIWRAMRLPPMRRDDVPWGAWGLARSAGTALLLVLVGMAVASSTYSPFIYFRF